VKKEYDVVIIGCGPAGIFAARELVSRGLSVLVVDGGKDVEDRVCRMKEEILCRQCDPCDVMCGVGGAGTFSDGLLNLRPDIGGDLSEQTGDLEKAWELVKYVDRVFLEYGAPDELLLPKGEKIKELEIRAASVGARFVPIGQRHIGSDRASVVIKNFKDDLTEKGVEFLLKTFAERLLVEDGVCRGVILEDGRAINATYVLIAPGRIGAAWVEKIVREYGIEAHYAGIDVGVRVEVPALIMDPITSINRDPKFHVYTHRYDDFVRTFCTNERGFVVKERYDDFIATNGHSMKDEESPNTNFAFLVRVDLTSPIENTTRYGRSIAKLATTIGGGRPIIQRMGDLRRGRRTTERRLERNPVQNTLKDVTPGDISMALPHRMVMDIIEGLEVLDKIIPGVASDSTLLYAPEIKFYAMKLTVDNQMETTIKNLFAAGDGAGLSRDIINAAATGVLAARGILKRSDGKS